MSIPYNIYGHRQYYWHFGCIWNFGRATTKETHPRQIRTFRIMKHLWSYLSAIQLFNFWSFFKWSHYFHWISFKFDSISFLAIWIDLSPGTKWVEKTRRKFIALNFNDTYACVVFKGGYSHHVYSVALCYMEDFFRIILDIVAIYVVFHVLYVFNCFPHPGIHFQLFCSFFG